jgi:hypothetical protein
VQARKCIVEENERAGAHAELRSSNCSGQFSLSDLQKLSQGQGETSVKGNAVREQVRAGLGVHAVRAVIKGVPKLIHDANGTQTEIQAYKIYKYIGVWSVGHCKSASLQYYPTP